MSFRLGFDGVVTLTFLALIVLTAAGIFASFDHRFTVIPRASIHAPTLSRLCDVSQSHRLKVLQRNQLAFQFLLVCHHAVCEQVRRSAAIVVNLLRKLVDSPR